MAEPTRVLEALDIRKTYGSVVALDGVDFAVSPGEVVALVGDNGAGKSTFVKIISGALVPDSGHLDIDGVAVHLTSPALARSLGIDTVYQDLALAPDLSSAANLFLGREIKRQGVFGAIGLLDRAQMRDESRALLERLAIRIKDLDDPVGNLSGGQRQSVAVARAVAGAGKIVVMDEPTAALGVEQTRNVLDLIRRVKDSGVAVVLISHNMADVLDVADRIVVLRLGKVAASFNAADVSLNDLVSAITGANLVQRN